MRDDETAPPVSALEYPWQIARDSFVLYDGETWPLVRWYRDPLRDGDVLHRGRMRAVAGLLPRWLRATPRWPVLASGSNAAPSRLAEKLRSLPSPRVVAAIHCSLRDFDAVYSAHFARYGALPATLHPHPGADVDLSVLFLTEAQLDAVNRTEALGANYDLLELARLDLRPRTGTALRRALAYVSRRGALRLEGSPTALSAVPARRSRLRRYDQRQVLERARRRLAPSLDWERFRRHLADPRQRHLWTERLAAEAERFVHRHARVVSG